MSAPFFTEQGNTMRFMYIGGTEFDGTPLPSEVVVQGIVFACNVPTELPDSVRNYEYLRTKLMNHRHFQVVPDPMVAVAQLSEEEATQLVENVFDAPAPKKRGRPRKTTDISDAAE